MSPHCQCSTQARGATLIEALVALLVMCFGMLALMGVITTLRHSGDVARQRSEAMRLAQADMAALRAYSVLALQGDEPAGTRDYDSSIVTRAGEVALTPANTNTSFTVTRTVTPLLKDSTDLQARTVAVTVRWKDRADIEEALTLHSIIARSDPAFAGATSLAPPLQGVRTPQGRHPAIPVSAQDLGNRLSALRPGSDGPTVWLLDNASSTITGVCSIPVGQSLSALTPADIETCTNNTVGYLVTGSIRFASTAVPSPSAPDGTARPLTVSVALTPSQLTVKNAQNQAVLAPGRDYPVTPDHVCFSDAPPTSATTQPVVDYRCIVHPNTQSPRNWSGQVLLNGINLGVTAAQFRVCRYSADYNGNGRIDNEEHPASYSGVSQSLARQNFLVVRGDASCPTAPAVDPAAGVFVDHSTQPHQPP